MNRPYLQYDVFTDQPLSGNQLAVFTDSQGLDLSTMQRIAREMNFPESTFILPVEWAGTDIRMRIFTPATEMPVAGHPTIGSTFALADVGVITPGTPRFVFHLNIGPTPVDLEWTDGRLSFAWMTQPNPVFGPIAENRMLVAEALSLTPDDLLPGAPVQEVSCGVPFLYVPLRDPRRSTARSRMARRSVACEIDRHGAADLPVCDGCRSAPNPAYGGRVPRQRTRDCLQPDVRARIRHHRGSGDGYRQRTAWRVPGASPTVLVGPPEGGRHEGEGRVDIVSRQGVAMGRASRIHISIGVADGVINDVKVGGQAVLVARGEFLV